MNIARAKEEIKNAVKAYIAKDEDGNLLIPEVRQRPVLLIGPPGIGKTAVMKQIASELDIGLASYTMTHHTRQSAMGLPFIEKRIYDGKEQSVTSYTMSEIIASVYELIEKTGLHEGILFIDEINCVSETLAPIMLQFLQNKVFGNSKVPKGWVIVAAGNPATYNRSVRELDVVTLDRVKLINVEPDYDIWKEYALKSGVHQSILSYLDARRDNFYRIEATIDGKRFVTARGWEDLSDMIKALRTLGLGIDEEVIVQYIQHPDVAMDFANYLTLYYKYEETYSVSDILDGVVTDIMKERLVSAPFDERVSVAGLVLGGLSQHFKQYCQKDAVVTEIFGILKTYKEKDELLIDYVNTLKCSYTAKQEAGLIDSSGAEIWTRVYGILDERIVKLSDVLTHAEQFTRLTDWFATLNKSREMLGEDVLTKLNHAFDFAETVYGNGPEMVYFVTELAANYYSLKFIQDYGCERFYRCNRSMLKDNARNELLKEIGSLQ